MTEQIKPMSKWRINLALTNEMIRLCDDPAWKGAGFPKVNQHMRRQLGIEVSDNHLSNLAEEESDEVKAYLTKNGHHREHISTTKARIDNLNTLIEALEERVDILENLIQELKSPFQSRRGGV